MAEALRTVPRSPAWDGMDALAADRGAHARSWPPATTPTPRTRRALAEDYARRIPGAELVVEDEGQAPLAWQGARLSKAVAGFLGRAGYS